jgi:hypothetical protein
MSPEPTLKDFLRDLGLRIGAAVVVVSIFFALGYINRVDFLGLSSLLGGQLLVFGGAFLLVSLVSLGWIFLQRYRS